MKVQTLQYQDSKGWSEKTFPDMDSPQTLIIIFAAPKFIHDPAPIKEVAKHYPQSKIIGCSSAGEIHNANIFDDSLSVAIIHFKNTAIEIVKQSLDEASDSTTAGENVASSLLKDNLRGILVLSDGLNINGTELSQGLNKISNGKITITGGLAGDGKDFKQTWTIYNDEINLDTVVAAGFYGDNIQIGHASRGGWDPFGLERRITRATGNILYELDDQPALSLYKTYLGDRAADLPASGLLYPLAIRKDINDTRQLVRTILAIDEDNESLTFAGDMPVGYMAQLMRANFERLITSAGETGDIALDLLQKNNNSQANAVLSISISCVGRRLLMGERTEEETEAIMATLPKNSHQIGFYSYGELSPVTTGACDLHNQTMTLTLFYES